MNYLEGQSEFLTTSCRNEIMESLYHKVLQHTQTPTSKENSAVGEALVEKFPMQRDGDPDAPFVSYCIILKLIILTFVIHIM